MTTTAQTFGFAAALSTKPAAREAVDEVCREIRARLGSPPDLVLAFFSADYLADSPALAADLCRELDTPNVLGCSGESIVGGNQEIEGGPALSVWAARLPDTHVVPMHLQFARTAEGGAIVGWPEALTREWPSDAKLIVFGDPYTFPAEVLLELMNDEHPGVPVLGGMASAASQPGENRLLDGPNSVNHGAVAVMLHGGVRIQSLVSQGCRPIGRPFVVTRAERNIILELGGQPAYQRLVEVYQTLATHEQEQLRQGLHVGRVVNEYLDQFEQGDFLVRNVLGMDVNSGAIAVGDYFRAGQTIQFHVRDCETADGELRQLLAAVRRTAPHPPGGALLFTCNGRGTRLFPQPHHDAQAIADVWSELPLAGFFAAGELGPIGGRNFVHGFTASVALFESPTGVRE